MIGNFLTSTFNYIIKCMLFSHKPSSLLNVFPLLCINKNNLQCISEFWYLGIILLHLSSGLATSYHLYQSQQNFKKHFCNFYQSHHQKHSPVIHSTNSFLPFYLKLSCSVYPIRSFNPSNLAIFFCHHTSFLLSVTSLLLFCSPLTKYNPNVNTVHLPRNYLISV